MGLMILITENVLRSLSGYRDWKNYRKITIVARTMVYLSIHFIFFLIKYIVFVRKGLDGDFPSVTISRLSGLEVACLYQVNRKEWIQCYPVTKRWVFISVEAVYRALLSAPECAFLLYYYLQFVVYILQPVLDLNVSMCDYLKNTWNARYLNCIYAMFLIKCSSFKLLRF